MYLQNNLQVKKSHHIVLNQKTTKLEANNLYPIYISTKTEKPCSFYSLIRPKKHTDPYVVFNKIAHIMWSSIKHMQNRWGVWRQVL